MFKPDEKPAGPFLAPQWSVFVPLEYFSAAVQWVMQRRGNTIRTNQPELDVLVHPNSGCEVEDHSWWAFWAGEKWRLNLRMFSEDRPYH